MRKKYQFYTFFLLFMMSLSGVSADPLDLKREKEVAGKLADKAEASEILQLNAGGQTFQALLNNQSNEKAKGAVIILHGMGAHPDWPQTISPLRQALPEYGWTTLSIQLPIIAPKNQIEDYGSTFTAAIERIKAAIDFLHERKFRNIVAIGHSFGGVNMLAYLETEQEQKINALVAIGLQQYTFLKPAFNLLGSIEKTKIPVMDIFGSRDFKEAFDQAADRRLAAKKGNNKQYRQIEIDGADHYFIKMEALLIKRIRGWLDKAAPGVSVVVKKQQE